MSDTAQSAPKKRDVLTRLRAIIRGADMPRLVDRDGVSARMQWAALVVLIDRAGSDGTIPERFTPTAAELADATYSDERQTRRVLDVLKVIQAIEVKDNPGRRPTIRVLWPRDDTETADPGQDASPGVTPPLTPGQSWRDATPDARPGHPGQDASPTPGMESGHPGQDASPPPYVGSPVGSRSGITGITDPAAVRDGAGAVTKMARARKAKKTPPDSAPVWEAYRTGYAAANGEEPERDATTNSAITRLIKALGIEKATRLVTNVFASPVVRERYPSILKIAHDPAAVRAALSAAKSELTAKQLAFARKLFALHREHPVVQLLAREERGPTLHEFEQLVSYNERTKNRHPNAPPVQRDGSITADVIKQEEQRKVPKALRSVGLTPQDSGDEGRQHDEHA